MIELEISKLDEGQKLKKLCFKYFDKAPQSFTYKMLRKKNIVLNDKKADGEEILKDGDKVKLYLSDDTIRLFHSSYSDNSSDSSNRINRHKTGKNDKIIKLTKENIIYENDDYIIINKPAGILSQKASAEDYSINEAVIDHMLECNMISRSQLENFRPSVCNRLDRNTSGIITAGKTQKGLRYLSDKMREKGEESKVIKSYFAVVHGRFDKDGIYTLGFSKNEKDNTVKVLKDVTGSDYIKTGFRFLKYNDENNISLVEAVLYTGKSHQIRVSLQYLGFPIVGDRKYGDTELDRKLKPRPKRQLLHAGLLKLSETEVFRADFPKDIEEYF